MLYLIVHQPPAAEAFGEALAFLDGHIAKTESGSRLMVGPVHLTPPGVAALEKDRR